jgi:hypothetical protein
VLVSDPTYQLRTQYRELEGEFRSVFGNFKNTRYVDVVTAGRIVELLHSARGLLEASNPDLLAASSELALAERYMVWIYPPHILKPRGTRILSDLGRLDIREATLMREELTRALKPDVQELFGEGNALGILRAVLDEALVLVNHQLQQKQIGTGLQLRRLGALLKTGLVALVMFVAVSPLIINPGALLIGD